MRQICAAHSHLEFDELTIRIDEQEAHIYEQEVRINELRELCDLLAQIIMKEV